MVESLNILAKSMSRYCVGMEGNVSGKKDGIITIKASGSRLSNMTMFDWVDIDSDGNQISREYKKPSMELTFHKYLLEFDNINFISHTHPVNSLKVLCSTRRWEFANQRLFPDQIVFNGGKSCLVPYAKPGVDLTNAIKNKVEGFIEAEGYFPKLILLSNHGIITCGETIDECIIGTEICEKSAEIFNGTKDVNELKFLSVNDVNDLVNDESEKYRKKQLK